MNYAKGMFRLWTVVTGCWMAIAVSMHYDGEMQAYKFTSYQASSVNLPFEDATSFKMATIDDYAAWIVKNAEKRGTPQFDTIADAYKMMRLEKESYCESGPRTCKAIKKSTEINPYDKTDFRNWEPDWPKRLMIIFEYALAGPLVLLLLGVAAAWIARGFRTAPHRPEPDNT